MLITIKLIGFEDKVSSNGFKVLQGLQGFTPLNIWYSFKSFEGLKGFKGFGSGMVIGFRINAMGVKDIRVSSDLRVSQPYTVLKYFKSFFWVQIGADPSSLVLWVSCISQAWNFD